MRMAMVMVVVVSSMVMVMMTMSVAAVSTMTIFFSSFSQNDFFFVVNFFDIIKVNLLFGTISMVMVSVAMSVAMTMTVVMMVMTMLKGRNDRVAMFVVSKGNQVITAVVTTHWTS